MGPICSTFVHSHIHLHYMCKIDSQSDQPFDHNFPVFWIVDPIKPHTMPPWGVMGLIVWAYVHSQMNPDMYQIWCQSVQPFESFPDFWMCDPLTPPPQHTPWGIDGWLVFSLCPFPDESADVNQSWCQSVQPFDSFPWLLNVWPPKKPQVPPCVSKGNLFGVYRVLSIPRWICTCVPNLMPIGPAVWHLPLTFEFVTPNRLPCRGANCI